VITRTKTFPIQCQMNVDIQLGKTMYIINGVALIHFLVQVE